MTASCRLCWRLWETSLTQKWRHTSMNYTIEPTDPWYVRHGAALGAILAFVLLFAIFAWGMSM